MLIKLIFIIRVICTVSNVYTGSAYCMFGMMYMRLSYFYQYDTRFPSSNYLGCSCLLSFLSYQFELNNVHVTSHTTMYSPENGIMSPLGC